MESPVSTRAGKTGPVPESSRSDGKRKRPSAAAPGASGEASSEASPVQAKRMRRKLSCETCQRRKCRCDYDPVTRTCHRCRTLRIPCSFSDDASLLSLPEPSLTDGKTGLEERLEQFEAQIRDIKATLDGLHKSLRAGNSMHDHRGARPRPLLDASDSAHSDIGPEDIPDPADAGIGSAPAHVIREVTRQLTGRHRRLLEHINADVVQLGLLDDQLADELIRLFCRYRGDALLVCELKGPELSVELRQISPFLHSVCCIGGIPFTAANTVDPVVWKQLYEHMRMTLGQVVLASPLRLEDINAILLMSHHSNHSPTVADHVDYIDSWLLTGHCVQQAMLSISFSGIIDNVRQGRSTDADEKAIRLWANICRHHLHWAATTGRPSVIPGPYLNHCNILLNVFDASVQEGIVLADTLLYVALNRKLSRNSYLGPDGECEEFASWKQKWAHLFTLPRSSAFKLSYHAAYFILAVRRLENFDGGQERFSSELSDGVSSTGRSEDSRIAEVHALRFAIEVLETFLEISIPARQGLPIYLNMCVMYAALVIAQYWRATATATSVLTIIDMLTSLEEWSSVNPNMGLAPSYVAGLGKRRIKARMRAQLDVQHDEDAVGSPLFNAAEGLLGLGGAAGGSGPQAAELGILPGMEDIIVTPPFPSMEDFFGGGYLDFMR